MARKKYINAKIIEKCGIFLNKKNIYNLKKLIPSNNNKMYEKRTDS